MKTTRPYSMQSRADAVNQTRERIARAALQLLIERAYEDITLAAFAQAAGVSHQTVLNHFESKEGVARAAGELMREEVLEARAQVPPGDAATAVAVLVAQYERSGDANARWAATSERLGSPAELIDDARAQHQSWLEATFDEVLPTRKADRRRAINALHAATDVYVWKLLRRDLALSAAETERTMRELVAAVLDRLADPTR
jgi:AcrR family transcriptional regulator